MRIQVPHLETDGTVGGAGGLVAGRGEFGGSQTEVVIENKPREIAIRVPEVTVRG